MIKRSMMTGLALALLASPLAMTRAEELKLVTNSHGLTETVMTMRIRGDLTFGPDGMVKEHHIATRLDPDVAKNVGKIIANWKFQPYLQDGVAVNAKTYFQLTLAARPNTTGYDISVDNRRFSDQRYLSEDELGKQESDHSKCVMNCIVSQPRLPGYPMGLSMANVSGAVMVHLYLNPDGSVADAVIAQSALYNIRGRDKLLDDARKLLERDVLRFARGLKMAPASGSPLVGDNHLVGALPIIFNAREGVRIDNDGKWRLEQRGARNIAPWFVNDPDRWIGVSDAAGRGFVAMKSDQVKLVASDAKAP
ncbi:MAG: hypothetical protein JF567_04220 [Xanthomonadales bacterium]|nr:hypothetical protein [Xanthomonadales bacterium]